MAAATSCVYERPVYTSAPSPFDRSWDAAWGAAQDTGVSVTASDRSGGVIRGFRDDVDVTIKVQTQADGRVRVEFNAKGPSGQDAKLAEGLSRAYDRRMGR